MGTSGAQSSDRLIVRLFPLPNIVLLPRAILPLHIFEPRYREMTAEALASDKRIALGLLRPGWEKCYYGSPPIEPTICIGTILSHEQLPDGRYNFLLQGCSRAKIVREIAGRSFRLAEAQILVDTHLDESDFDDHRKHFCRLLTETALSQVPLVCKLRAAMDKQMSTPEVADILAFHLIDCVPTKKALLEEANVRKRLDSVANALRILATTLESKAKSASQCRWN